MTGAASFTVSGLNGALFILAALLFFAALVAVLVARPRQYWAALISLGLLLWVLTGVVKG
jgi:hypothetical protein